MPPSLPGSHPGGLAQWQLSPLQVLLLMVPLSLASADSGYSVKATRTSEPIRIDGRLDESAWLQAPLLEGFHQTRLEPGQPARDDTQVRILYDQDNLYVGFHCKSSHPEEVTAYTVQNEGFLHKEDNVTVILDPFLDHRNAHFFWTNLLGVRTDGRIVDDGEAFTTDWQGEWESMGSRVADGWVLEVRIPFSNFQFNAEGDEVTFGLMLDREQAHSQEWSNWTPDGVNAAKVSRYPHLTGLEGIRGRRSWGLRPYLSTQLATLPGAAGASLLQLDLPSSSQQRPGLLLNLGLDGRLDPTSWLAFKFTVNPDFAQVEADQDVLWLDTDERMLPERRPFFTEGDQLFLAPIRLFYSRRLAPKPQDRVLGGGQLMGKLGRTGFVALDVQTLEAQEDGRLESINSGVVRVQQDIGQRSNVSLLALNRQGREAYRVLGAEAVIHLWEEFFVQAQAARSWSPDPSPGAEAFHLTLHRYTTLTEFWIQLEDIGANFRAPLGYVPVIDQQILRTHFAFNWFPKLPLLSRVEGRYDGLWRRSHAGVESRHRERLALQPYLNDTLALYFEGVWDRNAGYDDLFATLGFVLFPNDWQSLRLTALTGRFLGAPFTGLSGALNLKLAERAMLKLNGFYSRSTDIPGASRLWAGESQGYQWSLYAQLRYHFSSNLYVRMTWQQGDAVGLVDINSLRGRLLDATLGWHYREGSDLFLVFSDQPLAGRQEQRLLAKLSFNY